MCMHLSVVCMRGVKPDSNKTSEGELRVFFNLSPATIPLFKGTTFGGPSGMFGLRTIPEH